MVLSKERQQTSSPTGLYPALLIFALLSFMQWEPPGFFLWLESFRWYFMVGIAVLVFIFMGGHLELSSAKFYLLFSVLSWLGVLMSLWRTPSPDQTLYYAVSMAAPFLLGLVFLPVISSDKGRLAWISSLLLAALLWSCRVVLLWLQQGEDIRRTLVGSGMDHNLVSLSLSLAATALMIIALYGDHVVRKPVHRFLRALSFLASLGLLACSFLTYSRSGFIVTAAGILFAIFTLAFSNQTKRLFAVLFILLVILGIVIPIVQISNPIWFIKFNETSRLDDPNTSVFIRTVLIQKAWGLIQENPIVGIGPDVFRTVYIPFLGSQSFYMAHNTYLAAWVENGILGLAAYIVWLVLWIRLFFAKWNKFDLVKRIVMATFIPFFIMLFFLDISGGVSTFMLIIFSELVSNPKNA